MIFELLPFGFGAWLFISIYIGSLLVIGWIGLKARKENTLKDFTWGDRVLASLY